MEPAERSAEPGRMGTAPRADNGSPAPFRFRGPHPEHRKMGGGEIEEPFLDVSGRGRRTARFLPRRVCGGIHWP